MAKWAIIKDGAVDSVLDRPQKVTIDGITYGSQKLPQKNILEKKPLILILL